MVVLSNGVERLHGLVCAVWHPVGMPWRGGRIPALATATPTASKSPAQGRGDPGYSSRNDADPNGVPHARRHAPVPAAIPCFVTAPKDDHALPPWTGWHGGTWTTRHLAPPWGAGFSEALFPGSRRPRAGICDAHGRRLIDTSRRRTPQSKYRADTDFTVATDNSTASQLDSATFVVRLTASPAGCASCGKIRRQVAPQERARRWRCG